MIAADARQVGIVLDIATTIARPNIHKAAGSTGLNFQVRGFTGHALHMAADTLHTTGQKGRAICVDGTTGSVEGGTGSEFGTGKRIPERERGTVMYKFFKM
jgi:hypothetical protein